MYVGEAIEAVTTKHAIPTPGAVEEAGELMIRFAERTGISSDLSPQRYVWTDAFAVCNFLGLAKETGEQRYSTLALRLVEQVHHVLGTYRADDSRTGWISGLGEQEGEAHPTRGGLRIGKPLPERALGEPSDDQLEWERDGQYFHYLTKWMHALNQMWLHTRQPRFNIWARELAKVAHDAFTYAAPGGRRMVWKMSTDLSRPLVPSMGHHDPLDGFITCTQLRATKSAQTTTPQGASLDDEVADFAAMIAGQDWATADPLGLGGLLADASRIAQLMPLGAFAGTDLLHAVLDAALRGLAEYVKQNERSDSASRRLAFRELGLAIGLSAVPLIEAQIEEKRQDFAPAAGVHGQLRALRPYVALRSQIQAFWLRPEHREARSWAEHCDINEVMLATSLVPHGFLSLRNRGSL